MNRIYRLIWSEKTGIFVPVSEIVKSGKKSSGETMVGGGGFVLKGLAVSLMLAFGSNAYALPAGGVVTAGSVGISSGAGITTITQSTPNAAINWQGFNIGQAEAVRFVQPNSNSTTLNRVLGPDPSSILGSMSANGKVFLLNPNGILFGQGAQVNVGGLVASTLDITDGDFMAGRYNFVGAGTGTVLNQGSINADGGYVALLGANVNNEGVISARLGTVALAAGNVVTLDVAGDGLLNVMVNQGAVNALAQNGGLILADGGQVVLTAQAAGNLLQSAVNNTGVIQAQTIENHNGTIKLMGDMQSGTVNVGGTLDASAPHGGDGGFIETSAAHVKVADNTIVTTQSAQGSSGNWLIDPVDFTIGAGAAGTIAGGPPASPSGDVSGSTLSTALGSSSVTILSTQGSTAGPGDINVNDAVHWSANTLTLTAARDININAVMTASDASLLVMTSTAGAVKVGMNADGFIGRVDFFQANGVTPRSGAGFLTINTLPYTVITSLGAEGSTTGTDLQGMRGSALKLAGNYALGSNIDASATSTTWAGIGFVPIGVTGTEFNGTFDGLGHTITGLKVNSGADNAGLFGSTGTTSTFNNVGLVGGTVTGAAGTGGLIGNNGDGSTVTNSYNTGTVSGASGTGGLVGVNGTGTITNSFTTGTVNGSNAGTGGLVGVNTTGAITNSYARGNVIGAGASTGGLVGSNTTGTISKSYASGNVTGGGADTGGLLGVTGASVVSDTYATGNVSGTGGGTGGLIGTSGGPVTTSYAAGSVGGGGTKGGLVGVAGTATNSFWDLTTTGQAGSAGGGLSMVTSDMKQQANFTSATGPNGSVNPNWDFTNTWVMYNGITYPLLRPFMTPLTVTANSATTTYNGAAQTGGSGVTYSPSTYNLAYLFGSVSTSGGGTSVGSYAITPSGLNSNQQGYIINYANGTLGITPAALGVAANAAAKVYDGLAFSGGNGVTYSGFQGSDTAASLSGALAYGGNSQGAVNAGSYNITPSGQSSTNYNISYVDGTLAVARAALGIAANSSSKIFGDTVSFTGSEFTSTGLKHSETVGSVSLASPGAVSTAGVAGSPYAITASAATGGTFNPNNYTISYVNGSLGVIAGGLAIAANPAVKTYDGLAYSGGNGVTYTGFQGSDTAASLTGTLVYGGSSQGAVNAGNYTIIPSGQSSSNYTISYANGVLNVIPAPLGIVANNISKTYGSTVNFTDSEFSITGLKNSETVGSVSLASAGAAPTAAVAGSPYAITPSNATGGTFTPSNYTLHYINGVLTVIPVSLKVTASNATKIYGQDSILSAFTTVGLMNGETVGSVTMMSSKSAAFGAADSLYAVTPSNATGGTFNANNYTISYIDGALTVMPLMQTVPIEEQTSTAMADTMVTRPGDIFSAQLAGLNLEVIDFGVAMPSTILALLPVMDPGRSEVPAVIVPSETPQKVYVVPHRPRKPDRN